MANQTLPIAELHNPEELLENAEALLASRNPKMLRAVILEAITALESYVQMTLFPNLESKIDPALVEWLEANTRMNFDVRLSILTPVATGISVDRQSKLWRDYKSAKEIRNKITHSGKKASESEARFVIDTVYKWLAYLGRTAGLELALVRFKKYIEENNIPITSPEHAGNLIVEYFGRTTAAQGAPKVIVSRRYAGKADVLLKFGDDVAVLETKHSTSFSEALITRTTQRAKGLASLYRETAQRENPNTRVYSVVVFFVSGNVPDSYNTLRSQGDDVHVLVIKYK